MKLAIGSFITYDAIDLMITLDVMKYLSDRLTLAIFLSHPLMYCNIVIDVPKDNDIVLSNV